MGFPYTVRFQFEFSPAPLRGSCWQFSFGHSLYGKAQAAMLSVSSRERSVLSQLEHSCRFHAHHSSTGPVDLTWVVPHLRLVETDGRQYAQSQTKIPLSRPASIPNFMVFGSVSFSRCGSDCMLCARIIAVVLAVDDRQHSSRILGVSGKGQPFQILLNSSGQGLTPYAPR